MNQPVIWGALGNGLCTCPVELDCRMESTCETCSYFRTGTEFLPVLIRFLRFRRQGGRRCKS